jgi:hypothetical protein
MDEYQEVNVSQEHELRIYLNEDERIYIVVN